MVPLENPQVTHTCDSGGDANGSKSKSHKHGEPSARRVLLGNRCDGRVRVDLTVRCRNKLDRRRRYAPALCVDASLGCSGCIGKARNKGHVCIVHASAPQPIGLTTRLGEHSVRKHIVEKYGLWYGSAKQHQGRLGVCACVCVRGVCVCVCVCVCVWRLVTRIARGSIRGVHIDQVRSTLCLELKVDSLREPTTTVLVTCSVAQRTRAMEVTPHTPAPRCCVSCGNSERDVLCQKRCSDIR